MNKAPHWYVAGRRPLTWGAPNTKKHPWHYVTESRPALLGERKIQASPLVPFARSTVMMPQGDQTMVPVEFFHGLALLACSSIDEGGEMLGKSLLALAALAGRTV